VRIERDSDAHTPSVGVNDLDGACGRRLALVGDNVHGEKSRIGMGWSRRMSPVRHQKNIG